MRELFGEDDDYYNCVLSDEPLDIDEGRLYGTTTKSDIERSAAVFTELNVDVSGGTAGGICGQNSGTITDCFFSGNASSDGKSGGICGSNSGTIESTVSLCAGAAVGENTNGSITNCLYNIDIAGRQKFGSGLETTDLTDPSILEKLGSKWSKAANTTTDLFYPELTVFKTDKYNVGVNYRLTLENTDKSPTYKDNPMFARKANPHRGILYRCEEVIR